MPKILYSERSTPPINLNGYADYAGRVCAVGVTHSKHNKEKATSFLAMATVINAQAQYEPTVATRLAHAALEAYEPPAAVEKMAKIYWGPHCQVWFFNVESTQCGVVANEEEVLVCFRGSEKRLEDVLVDLDFSLVPGPLGGSVHAGFYDGLTLVWSSLDELVLGLMAERPRRLLVTGHSLGGALATLAAAQWRQQGQAVHAVYTYGQPRSGDSEFARAYDLALRARSFRLVNNLDAVTRVPPRAMGYSHMGTLVYFDNQGSPHHGIQWWRNFLNGWCGAIENILDWCGEGLRDHRMVHYLERLAFLAPAMPYEQRQMLAREKLRVQRQEHLAAQDASATVIRRRAA